MPATLALPSVEPIAPDHQLEAAPLCPLLPAPAAEPETPRGRRSRPRSCARQVARRKIPSPDPASRIAALRRRIERGSYPTAGQVEIAVCRLIDSVLSPRGPARTV